MIFTAREGALSLGIHSMSFYALQAPSKANATCLSIVPPSAVALRVRSLRKSGHNMLE